MCPEMVLWSIVRRLFVCLAVTCCRCNCFKGCTALDHFDLVDKIAKQKCIFKFIKRMVTRLVIGVNSSI